MLSWAWLTGNMVDRSMRISALAESEDDQAEEEDLDMVNKCPSEIVTVWI